MAWTYYPRCRFDSQGAPQSPFQGGTPVGSADRGFAWGNQSIFTANPTPNITMPFGGTTQGYVLDDTDGIIDDGMGGFVEHQPWPGGTITSFTYAGPSTLASCTSGYEIDIRRRSDGAVILLQSNVGFGPPVSGPFGFPTYATNPFTALPWSASELMGSAAAYDFYFILNADVNCGGANLEFIRFAGALFVEFTPIVVVPAVTSVSPTGSVDGGQSVTIHGEGFTGATQVEFCGVAATSVVVVNDTTITAVTPAHVSGGCSVEVLGVATGTDLYAFVIPRPRLPQIPVRSPIRQGDDPAQKGSRRGR